MVARKMRRGAVAAAALVLLMVVALSLYRSEKWVSLLSSGEAYKAFRSEVEKLRDMPMMPCLPGWRCAEESKSKYALLRPAERGVQRIDSSCTERLTRPTIIVGGCAEWPASKKWSKHFFESTRMRDTDVHYVVSEPQTKGKSSLKDYLQRASVPLSEYGDYVIFSNSDFLQQHPEMANDYAKDATKSPCIASWMRQELKPPITKESFFEQASYFTLAPMNSGGRWHRHGLTFNAMFAGRKRWLLYDPSRAVASQHVQKAMECSEPGKCSCTRWFSQILPSLDESALPDADFVQSAGDILYLPHGWYHCTINIDDNVNVALQVNTMKASDPTSSVNLQDLLNTDAKSKGNVPEHQISGVSKSACADTMSKGACEMRKEHGYCSVDPETTTSCRQTCKLCKS